MHDMFALDRDRFRELIRFCFSGLLCALLNLIGVMLLTELAGLHYLTSLAISSAAAATVGFILNRWWTFRVRGTAVEPEYLRYLVVAGAQIIVSLWFCAWLVDDLRVPYLPALIGVAAFLAPLSYVLHRAWSFGLIWLGRKPPA
jgi:putative flippase GtrA